MNGYGIARALTGLAMPSLGYSYAIPVFGALTIALVMASWRRTSEGRT